MEAVFVICINHIREAVHTIAVHHIAINRPVVLPRVVQVTPVLAVVTIINQIQRTSHHIAVAPRKVQRQRYMDAFARYYIDENCLFRYANRRKSAKKIKKLLHDKTDIILKTKE